MAVEDHHGHHLGQLGMPHRDRHRRVKHLHHHLAPPIRLQLLVQHLIRRQVLPVGVSSCPREPGDTLALDVPHVLRDLEERVEHCGDVSSLRELDGVDVVLTRVPHHKLPLHSDPLLLWNDSPRSDPDLAESKSGAITNILQQCLQRPRVLSLLVLALLLQVPGGGSLERLGASCSDLLHEPMSRLLQLGRSLLMCLLGMVARSCRQRLSLRRRLARKL
mmetsp:Transcript_11198/g.25399  ORF Transcript_11198/g.25399 Transcript_11198/m.25399 type:complete len:219 (-) Transcript_11198:41-697(-)